MHGSYQIADLNITLDGSMKELALAQNVEREFQRACRRLRTQSGAEQVFFRVDTELEGENGTFHKFRLRAYAPESPEIYTIDCGITDENPLGIYVGWNAPIEIYNRETEQVRTVDPETGDVTKGRGRDEQTSSSASNPSGEPAASSTRQNAHESEKMYDTGGQAGPTPEPVANQLLQKTEGHDDDTPVREVTVEGASLTKKLVGLAEFLDHGNGYLSRVRDAAGVTDLGDVPMGQVREVVLMIVDEEALEENEQLQPGDDLPF